MKTTTIPEPATAPAPLPPPRAGDLVMCGIKPRKSAFGDTIMTAFPGVIIGVCENPAWKEEIDGPDAIYLIVYVFGDSDGQSGARQRKYVGGPREGLFCWPRPV